jgi:hypothetical protein
VSSKDSPSIEVRETVINRSTGDGSSLTATTMAGIAVGVVALILLTLIAVVVYVKRKRRAQPRRPLPAVPSSFSNPSFVRPYATVQSNVTRLPPEHLYESPSIYNGGDSYVEPRVVSDGYLHVLPAAGEPPAATYDMASFVPEEEHEAVYDLASAHVDGEGQENEATYDLATMNTTD